MAKPVTSPQAVVDVAINVYGKPYQTAVTLFSLIRQSGTWIDKVYFIEERRQPTGTDLGPLKRALQQLGKPVVYYRPWFWFWVDNELRHRRWLKYRWFRWATRYQYAWEKTDKSYLLVTHNDMLFTGDLVGTYLEQVGTHAGIGQIGQCWNCPAFAARVCAPTRYTEYQPTHKELKQLIAEYPPARPQLYETLDPRDPWPLPECRLNEYVALINLAVARPATMPEGSILPFGTYGGLDTAILWFREMNQAGYMFRHLDFNPWATHAWANGINSGHRALFDKSIYTAEEATAQQKLADEFGIVF